LIVWMCSFTSSSNGNENNRANPGNINGQIILDITVYLGAEPRGIHNLFLVVPQQGRVTRLTGSTEHEINDAELSTRAIQGCLVKQPASVSPNNKFVAECKTIPAKVPFLDRDEFILRRTGETAIMNQRVLGHRISGFLWSPDSHAIAVLTENIRVSLNP